ncbi:zinc finger protein 366-like isoform X1 [Struthio camelus]|uniref:zinc finger protein 366 isoform X1 n=2 Tax=Struthio camelus TaxID=8801 RepID=UPI00051E1981|nr:PREDICTED: zinc finger protein 366 isoform X1 [Struthio camelus australis]
MRAGREFRARFLPASATGTWATRNKLNTMKNEETSFNVDSTRGSPFSRCLPPLSPVTKPHRTAPFSEEFRPHLSHFRYGPPPLGDMETFQGSLEGGSRKRKSMPTKMPPSIALEGSSSPPRRPEDHHDIDSSSLPLIFQQPAQPKYNSQMIDLCNFGFQFYRTLEHFGAKPIKQEPVKPNMAWPSSPSFMQAPYSYYPKVHPGLMFPFIVPPNFHFRNPFQMKRPPEPPFRRAEVRESGENKQKVERVDVNLQIDDSYYVDVGGEQKRWQCPMCEKSYTSKYNLVTHILGHSGIKPHACTRCGKLFKQLSHLHTHMLTHQGTRPHKCQVCHKAFTQTSHLKRHMMQHSDIKPYNCRICGRGFAYPSELKAHESKHESGRENICVECGLDFPTLAQLKRHLTTHRGPIQYNCTECDKTFQYPSQLQNHMMKHKDIRPYICTECGMEFVQPHHLKQHSLTHKGVKEHKCGICGREFTLLANMKRHVLIHTNIRAYQCHLCFKSFVQKQTLKAHMIVHSDVKPFKCKLCGKEFNRMHNLMGHMHLHSDSKPFKCLYCPSKFTLKGNLTRHMKVKHGVMERGFHSQGFGRGRIALSQTNVLRSLEQEEPFDLSQKSQGKGISFHSDGESAKGSSCQEEEEDNCYEAEQYSPGMYHHGNSKLYVPQDLSGKPECMMKDFRESYYNEKEEMLREGGLEKSIGNSDKQESQGERNLANDKEHLSFRSFEKGRLGHSLSDYLYFKHRNKSLKELLERKMEKQTMLIGI